MSVKFQQSSLASPPTDTIVAAEVIDSEEYQRLKLVLGDFEVNDGSVSSNNPLPVTGVSIDSIKTSLESVITSSLLQTEIRVQPNVTIAALPAITGTVTANLSTTDKLAVTGINDKLISFSSFISSTVTLTVNVRSLLPPSQLSGRRSLVVYNPSEFDIYVGGITLLSSNGIIIPAGGSMAIDCSMGLYGICADNINPITINVLEML